MNSGAPSNIRRLGLVGLGLIGRERLVAGRRCGLEIVGGVDSAATAETLGQGAPLCVSVDALLACSPDLVTVSTPHDIAPEIVAKCLNAGVTVLMEKPLGRDLAEAGHIASLQRRPQQLFVGFNYRFFRCLRRLREDVAAGAFGDLVSVEITLGHGGSPDDRSSWKLSPRRAGGGCLIDPGVHALDLLIQLLGPDLRVRGVTVWDGFWQTGVEEEAHVLLDASSGTTAVLDLSIVRWRSEFRVVVNGTEGYGVVSGRGRSYGIQQYLRGRRWAWMNGARQADTEELVCTDDCVSSFEDELRDIITGAGCACSGDDAVRVMGLLDEMRQSSSRAAFDFRTRTT